MLSFPISFANAQSTGIEGFFEEQYQLRKEKFLDLGEKEFYKDCLNQALSMLGKDIAKQVCSQQVNEIKNDVGVLAQNESSSMTASQRAYFTHIDTANGFSIQHPSDWHVSGNHILKGTREFRSTIFDGPTYSLIDTNGFGDTAFDSYKNMDGVKITDNLARINIDDEPALTFSYTKDNKEIMATALIHNNIGYLFQYETLRENFDKDFDTMMHFFASIKFQ